MFLILTQNKKRRPLVKRLDESTSLITFKEVTDWILENRGTSDAFKDWTADQITNELVQSEAEGALLIFHCDKKILGVVQGEINWDYHLIYVANMLSVSKDTLPLACVEFMRRGFGHDWDFQWRHKGIMKRFNCRRVVKMISKLGGSNGRRRTS